MEPALALEAELVVTHNAGQFAVVAQGNRVVVSFPNLASLESLSSGSGSGGASSGLKKLEDLNAAVREMHLLVTVAVAGKPYLELGGRSYKITMAAVFGKLGSFFKNL